MKISETVQRFSKKYDEVQKYVDDYILNLYIQLQSLIKIKPIDAINKLNEVKDEFGP